MKFSSCYGRMQIEAYKELANRPGFTVLLMQEISGHEEYPLLRCGMSFNVPVRIRDGFVYFQLLSPVGAENFCISCGGEVVNKLPE